jgi:hypothetical protein
MTELGTKLMMAAYRKSDSCDNRNLFEFGALNDDSTP